MEESFSLSYQMSKLSLVQAVDSMAVSSDADVTHGAGVIQSSSTTQRSDANKAALFQTFPKTDLDAFLTRATAIRDLTLTSTNTVVSVVDAFEPWNLFLGDPFIAKKTSNYSLISGTIQVIAVVTAPAGAYGRYVISAIPNADFTNAVSPVLRASNCLQVDHCGQLDIAAANQVVLQLPWVGFYDAFKLNDNHLLSMWSVSVVCLQPVGTGIGAGTPVCNVKFYANLLDDYTLSIPHFQSKLKINDALKQHAPKIHSMIGEGKGSAMAGMVADVADKMQKIPVIGAFASTVGTAARVAEGVLGFFGFTREPEEKTPIPVTQRSVTNVAHTDGGDASDTCALNITNSITIDPHAGGFESEDCLACPDFFKRWTLIKTADWTPSQNYLDVITTFPVSPSYCRASGLFLTMTTPGYYGLPFEFWRGGMEYMIVVPVSKMHRGSFQAVWVPLNSTLTVDVTNVSMNAIFDAASGVDHKISVGFASEIPYLENRILTDDLSVFPVGACNGFVSLRVVNPLTSQSDLAATTIFIFARAAPDMDFQYPRDSFLYQTNPLTPVDFVMSSQVTLQAGALGDDLEVGSDMTELVPSAGVYPGLDLLWGEQTNSIRALLQKPSKLAVHATFGGNFPFPTMFMTPGFSGDYGATPVWTYAGYYRAPFLGIAASEVFKIFPKADSWIGMFKSRKHVGGAAPVQRDLTGTLAPMTFCGANMGGEFRLPYYSNKKYYPANGNQLFDEAGPNSNYLVGETSGGTEVAFVSYYSLGPDIRATCFRQIPLVVLTETPLDVPRWW